MIIGPRCACGSRQIMAVEPGDRERRGNTGEILTAGRPARAWCLRCWTRQFGRAT